MTNDIELGDKVQCTISGFTGIAVSRVEFINGCIQYTVVPKCKKNTPSEGMDFDEQSLKIITPKKKKIVRSDTGGPMRKPKLQRGY